MREQLNVSPVEYKLLSDPVTTNQAPEDSLCTDAEQRAYGRDIFKRIGTKSVCRLSRQLATLLRAGMPLVPALSAVVEQLNDEPIGRIIEQARNSVNEGGTLSAALAKHPDVFSPLFVNMVAAGEASGTLEEVLVRLARILEKRVHLAGRVKAAVAYPVMMIVVAAAVVVFLLSFVVPGITQIFIEMNQTLPWPTRLLISISAFIRTYLLLIAILVCVLFFAVAACYRTKEGRLFADRAKLKLPLFGKLLLKLEIVRLTRTLGILLISGIPILNALEIAKGVIQNRFIAQGLDSVKARVSRGDNTAGAIKKTGLFPPIVFHTLATSQISATLEDGLAGIADMYDDEIELTVKTLTSLLEPAILLVMGVIVSFIVTAILLPIFEINQAF